ncbi:MAG: hypothetical protein IKE17_05975 [Clostridia bacterium]|nr:hypothetical protein [Clostridia bacterium]
MPDVSNAQRLRSWMFGCTAIDEAKRFGVDYLGDEPTEYALITVPSTLKWKENILGERKLKPEQEQNFIFASQEYYGADVAQNLQNLAFYQAVMNWIMAQNEAQSFPEWEGGIVTGVTPTLTGGPIAYGAGVARYQIQIRVDYKVTDC